MNTQAKLNEILVFMAVADGGSFVAGGRVMGLTGSAASKAVMRLENRLGTRLFHRTTRAISLTNEGRAFYEGGLRIIEAVEQVEAGFEGAGEPRGTLRLSVPAAFGRLVLLPVVQRYLELWPNVHVEINFTDRPVDLVEEGVDLAVRIGAASAGDGLISRVVATYEIILCASPDYIAAKGEPRTPEHLSGHDSIVFRSRTHSHSWVYTDEAGESVRYSPRSRLSMDSGEAIRDAALAGLGIAYLPEFLLANDIADERLCRVLPNVDFGKARIVALYPSRRLLQPRVRHFIDLMTAELG